MVNVSLMIKKDRAVDLWLDCSSYASAVGNENHLTIVNTALFQEWHEPSGWGHLCVNPACLDFPLTQASQDPSKGRGLHVLGD